MTTETKITESQQAVQVPLQIKAPLWPSALAILLFMSLIGAAIWVIPPKGEDFLSRRRALEATSARYQGLADHYAASNEAAPRRGLEAASARYQGLADHYAASHEAALGRGLEAMSARYQGLAEYHAASNEAALQRGLEATSARYQGLAEYYQARNQ